MIRLIWETIRERKWPVIIYSLSSALLLLLYVALYPSLQAQSQQLAEVLKTLPEGLLKALGSSSGQLSNFTLEALLASKQFSMVWQLLAAILAISIAGNDLSAEIEKGTIEFLLSQPISRLRLYFARFISGSILLIIFSAVSTLLVMPMAAAFNVAYNGEIYYKLFLVASLFSLAVYAIAYCLSAIFSTKGRVFGIGAGLITAMYVAFLVSSLKDNLSSLKYVSFFHYFSADLLYTDNIDKLGILIFVLTIVAGVGIGAAVFEKRDIVTS
jgi:ABC-2 type transport system permease protein